MQLQKLPSLPPVFIATAEYDVLRDEDLAYAEKLQAAGVSVTRLHAPDMHHNFPVHPATVARFPQVRGTQPVRRLVAEDNACSLVMASSAMLTAAAGVTAAHSGARGMFAAAIMAGIAHMAIPVPRFVCVEIVVRLLPACGIGSVVSVMRIIVVVDVPIKSVGTVKPRASPDKYSPIEPIRAIVAIGCAIIRSEIVIAVRTHRCYADVDGYLRGRTRKAAHCGCSESRKCKCFQMTHLFLLSPPP